MESALVLSVWKSIIKISRQRTSQLCWPWQSLQDYQSREITREDDHWGIVDSSITGWLLEVKMVWSRSSQEGCISPLCLPPRSCFNQEFWEGAAAKALGVPSDVLKLKYCILESIQTEIWIVPKHLQNGKKRITLFCFLFLTEVPNSAVSVNFLVRF